MLKVFARFQRGDLERAAHLVPGSVSNSRRRGRSVADRCAQVVGQMAGRRFSAWPDFRCCAIEPRTGEECQAPAKWQQLPVEDSTVPWFYCDRCAPKGATPIPAEQPYAIARLDLRVAVALAPGDLDAAADDAVRRVLNALEGAGVLITGLRVVGHKATEAAPAAAGMRLMLAGPPQAAPARSSFVGAPAAAGPLRWRQRRRAG